MSDRVLVAESLGKTYPLPKGDLRVFEGLDFELGRGELAAIMGASGVGKTTLLNLLGGLDRPSEGRVLVDGEELFAGADREVAAVRNRKIGFVFQVYHLLPEFTSLENVGFPLMIGGVPKKEAFHRALGMLLEVGLEDKAHSRPRQRAHAFAGQGTDGQPRPEDRGKGAPARPRPPQAQGAVLHPRHPQREDRPLLPQGLHDGGGDDETFDLPSELIRV